MKAPDTVLTTEQRSLIWVSAYGLAMLALTHARAEKIPVTNRGFATDVDKQARELADRATATILEELDP